MGYVVRAPLVQAKTGSGYVHVYEGGSLPDDQDAEQLQQMLDAGLVEETDGGDGPPGRTASKAKWRAYAITHGHTDEEVADMSRDDIRDLFDE